MRMHHHRHHGFGGGRERWSRHGFGGHGFGGESGEGRHGGRRGSRFGRFMEHGGLRSVILVLIGEQPRHGYELIKELETRSGGAYRPSPGVIYPTLALLEDEGLIRPAQAEAGRKLYELTEAGREALPEHEATAAAIFGRMSEAGGSEATRPRIHRAMGNLALALRHRLAGRSVSDEQLDAIVKAIDDAAAAIEKA